MTVQHRNIVPAECHEPKGIDTAPAGARYVADGAGGGVWTVPEDATKVPMYWEGSWAAGTYQAGDVVRDAGWQMIANKETTDPAAPQAIGVEEHIPDQNVVLTTVSDISVVKMIHRYVFNEPHFVTELWCRIPEYTGDTNTKITLYNVTTDNKTIISQPIISNDEYTLISSRNATVPSGLIFEVWLEVYNAASANSITGGWTSAEGVGTPTTGNFEIDNLATPTRIAFHNTDLDSVSRTTELQGVIVGSSININETSDVNRNLSCKVSAIDTADPTFTVYTVNTVINGPNDIRDARTCSVQIDVPITQPTQYSNNVNYWTTNPPTNVAVTSELYFDNIKQVPLSDAYGISLLVQEAYLSPDWEVLGRD